MIKDNQFLKFAVAGLLLTIFTVAFSIKIYHETNDELKKDYIYNVNMIKDAFDYTDLTHLKGNSSDVGTYYYNLIKKELRASLLVDDSYRFIYLVGKNVDNQVVFYADSELEGSSLESPAGQIYYEADEAFSESLQDGLLRITKPYEDRWGTWITVINPIISPTNGDIEYAICIDKSSDEWFYTILRKLIIVLITYITTMAILILLYYKRSFLYVEAIGLLLVGLVLSMFWGWYSFDYSEVKNRELFKQMSDERTSIISDSLNEIKYIELPSLNGFLSNFEINEYKFKSYSKFLRNVHYVQAWEWIPIVYYEDKESFEEDASKIYGEYSIWEKDGSDKIPVRKREVYYPVLYITPIEDNVGALGFDLGSEIIRKEGLESAKRYNIEIASEPIKLVQNDEEQKAILVYTPITDQISKEIKGFGVAVINLYDVVNINYNAWQLDESYPLYIEVYNYNDSDDSLTFLETTNGDEQDNFHWNSKYNVRKPLFIFGKIYFLLSHESENFSDIYPTMDWWINTFIGLVLTLTFSASAYAIKNSQIELHNRLKERTKQLHSAEDEFIQRIYKSHDSTLVIQREDYKFLIYNDSFLNMFGFKKDDEIDNLTPSDISPVLQPSGQSSLDLAMLMIEKAFNEGFNRFEWMHMRKDGSLFPADITLTATVYQGNSVLVCLLRDITEEKENEKAFSDLMYRFSIAADSAEIGIWDLDLITDKLKWDRWMFKIYGVTEESFKESNEEWEKRIHPEDYFETIRKFDSCIEGKNDYDSEFRIIRPNGEIRTVKSNGKAINDFNGKAVRIIGVNIDITDRRKVEENLIKANLVLEEATKKAEMANMIKSQFLANMSHEIRTPMNGVIGMTSLLSDTVLTAEQRQYVDIIRSSGQSLLDLINDILDFSKIEANKLQIENIDFNLRQVVDELTDLIAVKTKEKGIDLLQFIDPKIPDYLNGDPGRIRQILINLVSNAVKFTSIGSVFINLFIKEVNEDMLVIRFEVIDSGIGIAEEKLNLLFNEFEQIDPSNTRKYGGTGLGLAICKKLSKLMGGNIGVDSKINSGSKFWFEIPLGYSRDQLSSSLSVNDFKAIDVYLCNLEELDNSVLKSTFDRLSINYFEIDNGFESVGELLDILQSKKNLSMLILGFSEITLENQQVFLRFKALRNENVRLVTLVNSKMESEVLEKYYEFIDRIVTVPIRQSELYDMLVDWSNGIVINKTDEVIDISSRKDEIIKNTDENIHLLLAEDNITNQKVAVGIIEKLGYKLDVVANGAEAIEALKVIPYDLVLMDVQMPELDGYEATRLIRSGNSGVINKDVTIIAMTANAMKGDMEVCIEAGMNDYIPKPIDPTAISKSLYKWLDKDTKGIVFDVNGVLKRMMKDYELAWVTFEAFEEDYPRQESLITKYIESEEYESLLRTVHGLKGAALNVGGIALSKVAAEYESKLNKKAYSKNEFYYKLIKDEAEKLLAEIGKYKERIKDKF